jgi:hypothetical protein
MSFIDTDEYLVPMKGLQWDGVLDDMEKRGVHVLKMRSSRGLPRHDLMQNIEDQSTCADAGHRSAAVRKLEASPCQEPARNETFLRVYNCDYIKPPRPDRFSRAMKQIYRPEYVLSHYVHYSTVTRGIARYFKDQEDPNEKSLVDWQDAESNKELFLDELSEGTLVHARSVLPHETAYRLGMCASNSKFHCPLGYICPDSLDWIDDKLRPNNPNPFVDESGNYCNCWINHHVEDSLVPKLEGLLQTHMNGIK